MYSHVTFRERIKVPPQLLGEDVEASIEESLRNQYEGQVNPDLGVVLAVTAIDDIGEGEIEPEDAGVYYPVEADVITFLPEMHEVIVGEVSEITEFGAFIDMGPIEGLCHVSQIMDDYVSYNEEQHVLAGEDGSRTLQEGDVVKARVTAVSLDEDEHKINLTMRQPGLGKLDWIEEEAEELAAEAAEQEQ
jgi:DNA-directed RNA polymerase subunit E'